MGKGSKRRPIQVDDDEFGGNWDVAFRRDKKNEKKMKQKKKLRGEPKKDQ